MKRPRNYPAQSLALPQYGQQIIPDKRKLAKPEDERYTLLRPKGVSDEEWRSAIDDAINIGFGLQSTGNE